jgi:hypothetical protein
LRAVGIAQRRDEIDAEHLEIDRRLKRPQMIAQITQPFQPFIHIEKSRLPAHRFVSDPIDPMESETPSKD